jgi:acyl CoA:acetate/3-ketoacid CoA transferase alpha subunit
MRERLMSLEKAATIVRSGDQIVFNGSMDWTPMAMLRQLARNGVSGLHTVAVVGGAMNLDFLIGAGLTETVETCSLGFGGYARVAPNYERYQKAGRVKMKDNT